MSVTNREELGAAGIILARYYRLRIKFQNGGKKNSRSGEIIHLIENKN